MSEDGGCLTRRAFGEVTLPDGKTALVERGFSLRSLGKPPWELEIDDLWQGVIPNEATDLVGTVVWRGVRFERAEAHGFDGRCSRFTPTSLDYRSDADTTYLRDVYVNGIRFARVKEKDFDNLEER